MSPRSPTNSIHDKMLDQENIKCRTWITVSGGRPLSIVTVELGLTKIAVNRRLDCHAWNLYRTIISPNALHDSGNRNRARTRSPFEKRVGESSSTRAHMTRWLSIRSSKDKKGRGMYACSRKEH